MQKKEQKISKRTSVGSTTEPHSTYINDVVEEVRRAAAWGQADHRVFTSFATIWIFISFYMFTSGTMLMQKINITQENNTRANGWLFFPYRSCLGLRHNNYSCS